MKRIPLALILIRALFGVIILFLAIFYPQNAQVPIVTLMVIGLLTDIFDGIIARRFNVSTLLLRRLDSTIDQLFWICVIVATYVLHPDFFKTNALKLYMIGTAELLAYIVCFIKFRKEVATHAIASKVWALSILAALVQVVLTGDSGWLFDTCFYLGVATRLEIIGILLVLKDWSNDVPSIYHAILLRKGKPIKRNKLFNG